MRRAATGWKTSLRESEQGKTSCRNQRGVGTGNQRSDVNRARKESEEQRVPAQTGAQPQHETYRQTQVKHNSEHLESRLEPELCGNCGRTRQFSMEKVHVELAGIFVWERGKDVEGCDARVQKSNLTRHNTKARRSAQSVCAEVNRNWECIDRHMPGKASM